MSRSISKLQPVPDSTFVEPKSYEEAQQRLKELRDRIRPSRQQSGSKHRKLRRPENAEMRERLQAETQAAFDERDLLLEWLSMHGDAHFVASRLILLADRREKEERQRARETFCEQHCDARLDNPDSLIVAALKILQQLQSEKVKFNEQETNVIVLLAAYITDRGRQLRE